MVRGFGRFGRSFGQSKPGKPFRGKPFTDTLEINSPSRAKPLPSSIQLGLSYGVPYDNAAFPLPIQSLFRSTVAVEKPKDGGTKTFHLADGRLRQRRPVG